MWVKKYTNNKKVSAVAHKSSSFDWSLGVLGLTFKPETDDMRDAPSLSIIPSLVDKGANIIAHDPAGMEEAKKFFSTKIICLILITQNNEFWRLISSKLSCFSAIWQSLH